DDSSIVTDADNLWAYVSSPSGGFIEVVPADCPDTCEGGAWGKMPVPPFFDGFIPVVPAPLRPGNWKLVAVGAGGDASTQSQSFRVQPCDSPCAQAPPPDPTYAKQAFQGILESINQTCALAKGLEITKKVQDAKDMYDEVAVDPSGSTFGMFLVKVAVSQAEE